MGIISPGRDENKTYLKPQDLVMVGFPYYSHPYHSQSRIPKDIYIYIWEGLLQVWETDHHFSGSRPMVRWGGSLTGLMAWFCSRFLPRTERYKWRELWSDMGSPEINGRKYMGNWGEISPYL